MAKINDLPDFDKMARELFKQLPHDVGQLGLSHFKGSFRKQGFTDYSFIAWVARLDDFAHKIMRKSDSLMNDVKVRSATIRRIEISTSLPYADIHNNGGKFSLLVTDKMRKYFWAMYKETGHKKWQYMATTKKKRIPIRIPQRQFIGHSAVLNKQIDAHIVNTITKIFNKHS